MSEISRDHHYVSQAYLRNWSDDGDHIYAYRTLVSHENVRKWNLRSIRGIAYHRDLYTTVDAAGDEYDDFERWLAAKFEQPAVETIERVISGRRLSPEDWHQLALFFAAQDVRTPASFLECMDRWADDLPELLKKTLSEAVRRIKEISLKGDQPATPPEASPLDYPVNVAVEIQSSSDEDVALIHAQVTAGRRLWIQSMRHLLSGTANKLRRHRWSIAKPAGNLEWITSDHPALKLNYHSKGKYDFKGGWGSPGTELILPISPNHLLYTQVDRKAQPRFTFSEEKTREMQKLLAGRAHRWILARKAMKHIAQFRPRIIDASVFEAEQEAWRSWHEDQRVAEMEDNPRVSPQEHS